MNTFYLGLDLGQKQDPTALALIEHFTVISPERDRITWEHKTTSFFDVRQLRRLPLGLSYVEIVGQVITALSSFTAARVPVTLVVDATGVGAAVVDMIKAEMSRTVRFRCNLVPVTITAGDTASCVNGGWRVPKRDLLSVLQVALEQHKLRIAARLPERGVLMKELADLRGDMTTAWRTGEHDDLVFAVALAVWRAHTCKTNAVGYINQRGPILSF